jgi:hypothetical protein
MTNISKWQTRKFPWLPVDDLPADPICDFKTSDNKSSVYEIDEDSPLKRRLAIALAATKQKLDKVDYILLDKRIIESAEIKVISGSTGETPDRELNILHRNLNELSALRLMRLVKDIFTKDLSIISDRFYPKDIAISVWQEVASGRYDKKRIQQTFLTDACIKVLKSLSTKKLNPEEVGKAALKEVSQYYMNELKAGRLDDKKVKAELINEAKKWTSVGS